MICRLLGHKYAILEYTVEMIDVTFAWDMRKTEIEGMKEPITLGCTRCKRVVSHKTYVKENFIDRKRQRDFINYKA